MNIVETIYRKLGVADPPLRGASSFNIPERCAALSTREVEALYSETRDEAARHEADRVRARAERDRITREAVERNAEDGGPPIAEPEAALAAARKIMAPWGAHAVKEYGVSSGTPLDGSIGARLERLADVLRERWRVEGEPKHVLAAREALAKAAQLRVQAERDRRAAAEALHVVRVVPRPLVQEYESACRCVDAAHRQYEVALAALRATGAADSAPEPPAAA